MATVDRAVPMSNADAEGVAGPCSAAPGLVTEVCEMCDTASEAKFSLGSFNLLEEILTGQEWARFVSPTPGDTLTRPGPNTAPSSQTTTTVGGQNQSNRSSLNPGASRNDYPRLRLEDVDGAPQRSVAQMPGDNSAPTGMLIPNAILIQGQEAISDHVQAEPMEHSPDQVAEEGSRAFLPSHFLFTKPADVLENSALTSRTLLNRKRGHQSPESAYKGEPVPLEPSHNLVAEQRKERDDSDFMMPLYLLKSPSPRALMPRGVLKHSISQDSRCLGSVETVTKKRRLEVSRRVRFSEDVVSIEPAVLLSDSEEDEAADEAEDCFLDGDDFLEEDVKMEPGDDILRPPPLPPPSRSSWMQALKKRQFGKNSQL